MLKIEGLTKHFGGLVAVDDVSFSLNQGDILGLIGPNGSGKTTVVNMITGILNATEGNIILKGNDLRNKKPHQIAKLGMSRTFQILKLFDDLTLLENVVAGMHLQSNRNLIKSILRFPILEQERTLKRRAMELLDFVGLQYKSNDFVSSITYGQGRMLDIARVMATGAEILLFDEPGAGLNTEESEILKSKLNEISALGKSILLIEHNMNLVMSVCNRIIVLNNGKKLAEDIPERIQANEEVIRVYLGSHAKEGVVSC